MIEKINTGQIQDVQDKLPSNQPNNVGALPDNETDVSLHLSYVSFIDEAMQEPQTDTDAIQLAQELLLSGQLESHENIRAAAANILELGI
ncbi:MAG: hypothetical protein ACYS8I_03560 [Planctomycetota bacterium]|jgi:hypothetical protein